MAEKKRFLWQTQNPYVRAREEELLATLAMEKADTVLEVGCGEGANIHNLRAWGCRTRFVGIDYSMDKVTFCRTRNLGNSQFLCGDVLDLPFPDDLFDLISCRDLLHHVNHDRKQAISEMIRVCKRDKKIVIIESNGSKLTLILAALLSSAEKGMIDSTPEKIRRMSKGFEDVATLEGFYMLEPSNLFRVVLHYQYGFPFLSDLRWFGKCLDFVSLAWKRVIREDRWSYIVLVLRKRT